jgi:hypothetical protein
VGVTWTVVLTTNSRGFQKMGRFSQDLTLARFWIYMDPDVRMGMVSSLILVLISAGILVANLID